MRTKHKNSHQDKNKTKSKNILLLPKKIIFLLKHGGMNITKKLNALTTVQRKILGLNLN